MLESETLVKSLLSDVCPACGGPKKPRHSMCGRDYRRLPSNLKAALYDRLGDGYEEAMDEAFGHLGVIAPHLPKGAPSDVV